MKKIAFLTALLAVSFSITALAGETASNKDAKQYFVNLKDGDTVSSPLKVIFGLSGMGVAPATVDKENTGHHHLFIDRPALGEGEDGKDEFDANIITDEHNVHFGKGQTEVTIELSAGKHTLQLVLGDKDHIPHSTPIHSDVITITVE